MAQDASGEYLRNAVMTATPGQLQLMLYDGAIRFARQAQEALRNDDLETSCEKLLRAQKIVLELHGGLRREVDPSLCDHMAGLYGFIHARFVDANMNRDASAIHEGLSILEHLRETWRMLIAQVRSENEPAMPETQARESVSGERLSVEG